MFVVNGYSTSRHWPRILQRKLDRYFDGERVIEIRAATKGSTPIARWINVETGDRLPSWREIVGPALQRQDDRPTIVLAQQYLQWAYGERFEGIRGHEDRERIQRGADVLQPYAEALTADGADQVFLAMHIYKHDQEPVIGNERLALADLIRRKIPNVHAGPDVWKATKEHYPKAFARDRRHPNEFGAEIMAQHWFETLLRHDGRDVPEWSRKELAQAIQSEAAPPNSRASTEAHDERIDWNRARELRRRVLAGEKLSEEEQGYLQRARQLRRNPARAAQSQAQRNPTASTGLIP